MSVLKLNSDNKTGEPVRRNLPSEMDREKCVIIKASSNRIRGKEGEQEKE